MRPIALLSLLAALPLAAPATGDPCAAEAAARAGGWIQGEDAGGSGSPVTARHKARIKSILDELAGLVREAYPEPAGSQGKIYRNYGLADFAGEGLATYELTANFKGYACDRSRNPDGEVRLMSETSTWLYLQVNSFWGGSSRFETPVTFLSSGADPDLYALQPPRVLRSPSPGDPGRRKIDASLPASIAAFPHFVYEGAYDSWEKSYLTREVSQVVFVTPDGKLPYDPVTVGEFLDLNEARLTAYLRDNAQYGGVEYHQGLLDRIPALRRQYGSRLQEAAYIRNPTWSESELAEANPFGDSASGYLLARRSSRYGSADDPVRPRFIAVSWRWQPEVPYSVRMHEAIKGRLDFARLAGMLVR